MTACIGIIFHYEIEVLIGFVKTAYFMKYYINMVLGLCGRCLTVFESLKKDLLITGIKSGKELFYKRFSYRSFFHFIEHLNCLFLYVHI